MATIRRKTPTSNAPKGCITLDDGRYMKEELGVKYVSVPAGEVIPSGTKIGLISDGDVNHFVRHDGPPSFEPEDFDAYKASIDATSGKTKINRHNSSFGVTPYLYGVSDEWVDTNEAITNYFRFKYPFVEECFIGNGAGTRGFAVLRCSTLPFNDSFCIVRESKSDGHGLVLMPTWNNSLFPRGGNLPTPRRQKIGPTSELKGKQGHFVGYCAERHGSTAYASTTWPAVDPEIRVYFFVHNGGGAMMWLEHRRKTKYQIMCPPLANIFNNGKLCDGAQGTPEMDGVVATLEHHLKQWISNIPNNHLTRNHGGYEVKDVAMAHVLRFDPSTLKPNTPRVGKGSKQHWSTLYGEQLSLPQADLIHKNDKDWGDVRDIEEITESKDVVKSMDRPTKRKVASKKKVASKNKGTTLRVNW
jgi:hypothetical protein